MSIHSVREWRTFILKRGVFGNALKFAHLQTTGEIDRTSLVCTTENFFFGVHLRVTVSNVIFPNVSRRSPIFEVSTLRDAEQAKNLVLNSPRILLNYKNGKICVSYPEDTLHI